MKNLLKLLMFAGLTLSPLAGFTATGFADLSLLVSDDDNAKYGEYNDQPESGGKLTGGFELSGDVPWSSGSAYWQMEGENIGLQSYDFAYTLTEPSHYKIKLTFDGSQQYTRFDSKTPFLNGLDGTLTLLSNWIAAPTSAGMTAFDSTSRTFDEEVHRDSINLEINLMLTEHWQFDATYQTLTRQGNQLAGGAIYFDASTAFVSILPTDIDEHSWFYRASLTYSNDHLINTVSYLVSRFDDKNDQLTWMNPFSISSNPNIGYANGLGSLSQSSDNDREELRASGSYSPAAIRGLNAQWDAAWSNTQQAGSLFPYTANPVLSINEPVPINSLDTSLDLFNGSLRLTYRPTGQLLRRLLLRGRYSVDDRNQNKDRVAFNYVRGDAANQPNSIQGVFANPHDFRKERTLIAADYRLPWWHSKATIEWERVAVERQNAAVSETETDVIRGILRFTPIENFSIRIEADSSDRSSSTYNWDQSFLTQRTQAFIAQTPVDQRFDNHPLLSQYHLANAETDELKTRISYTGLDRWSFGLDFQQQTIDYDKTVLGLQNTETGYYGIDIQFSPSEHFNSYAMASWSRYETGTAGRSFGGGIEKPANRLTGPLPQGSDPSRNWTTRIEDEVLTVNFGLLWQSLDKLSADANYTFVRTDSGFLADTGGSPNLDATGLPDIESQLHSINLSLTYQISDKTGMTVIYQYYDFEEYDWATSEVNFDSVPNVLGVGQLSLNGDVNLFGISFQRRF